MRKKASGSVASDPSAGSDKPISVMMKLWATSLIDWRALASNALIALKKQGILTAPRYAKDYTIVEAIPQQKMLSVG